MNDPAASPIRNEPSAFDLFVRPCRDCGTPRPVIPEAARRQVHCVTCRIRGGPRKFCGRCERVLAVPRRLASAEPKPHECWPDPLAICTGCLPERAFIESHKGERECLRCRLVDALQFLTWGTNSDPGWFAPVREALFTMPDPRFALTRVGPANRALWDLLSGQLPLTHEALDGLPQRRSIRHLRELLVTTGALPHRHHALAGLEALLEGRAGLVIHRQDSQALAAFGRWLILRRARRGRFTPPEIQNDRETILETARFLRWLERQDGSVDDLMQADVEAWLARRDPGRWRACDFTAWAAHRGIVSDHRGFSDVRRLNLSAAEPRSRSADSGVPHR